MPPRPISPIIWYLPMVSMGVREQLRGLAAVATNSLYWRNS
jgi:hypothetical protein